MKKLEKNQDSKQKLGETIFFSLYRCRNPFEIDWWQPFGRRTLSFEDICNLSLGNWLQKNSRIFFQLAGGDFECCLPLRSVTLHYVPVNWQCQLKMIDISRGCRFESCSDQIFVFLFPFNMEGLKACAEILVKRCAQKRDALMQYNISNDALHFTRGALSIPHSHTEYATLARIKFRQIWKKGYLAHVQRAWLFGMHRSNEQYIMIDLLLFCNGYL